MSSGSSSKPEGGTVGEVRRLPVKLKLIPLKIRTEKGSTTDGTYPSFGEIGIGAP